MHCMRCGAALWNPDTPMPNQDNIIAAATPPVFNAEAVADNKQFRKDLDEVLQRIKNSPRKSRERSLVVTKVQEAIMWLGMDLKELAGPAAPSVYPGSYDPANPMVHPPTDGVKL